MSRIEKLKIFLKDSPEDCFLQHALALEYVKNGEDVEAQGLFEKILDFDEKYAGTYYHLAQLHERNGREAEAIEVYEKGMQITKALDDRHAYSELQMALDELL